MTADCINYGNSIKDWPVFPDSADALKYLKQHFKLIILSNVDSESFSASNNKLGVKFDAVYTAEDIGNYKPSVANFEYMLSMLKRLGFDKSAILHTALQRFFAGLKGRFVILGRRNSKARQTEIPAALRLFVSYTTLC